jgi:hypothetical protein
MTGRRGPVIGRLGGPALTESPDGSGASSVHTRASSEAQSLLTDRRCAAVLRLSTLQDFLGPNDVALTGLGRDLMAASGFGTGESLALGFGLDQSLDDAFDPLLLGHSPTCCS